MPKIVLSKNKFIVIFILFTGLFVHSFVIYGPAGFNMRFYLLSIILFIFYHAFYPKIYISRLFLFLAPLVFYWFIQTIFFLVIDSALLSEHITTFIVLIIFLCVLLIVFGNVNYLKDNAVNVYKSIFIIFTAALFLYFLSLHMYGIQSFWILQEKGHDKMEYLNTLKNFVHADQAFLPRNSGFHISPNFWGGFCMFAFYILLYVRELSSNSGKLFTMAMAVVIFSLVITFSRGTYIAMIIGVIFLKLPAILHSSLNKKIQYILSFVVIIALMFMAIRYFADYEKVKDIVESKTSIEHLKKDARFRIWECHIDEFLEHPLGGEGLQRSKEVYVPTLSTPRLSGSHNTVISMLNFMGIIGTTIFVIIAMAIFAVLWNKSLKYREHHFIYRLGMSILLALFFYSLFEHAFIKLFFWGMIVMAIAIASYMPEKKEMTD